MSLKRIALRDFVIVEQLEVDFQPGFTTLTGETGAGKSIMLDALGLIAFSLIGCEVALGMGYATVVVIMAGMMTGIFGGVLRDVLCNQVPVVFRHELYASVSLAVCILYLVLRHLGMPMEVNTLVSFAAGLTFRLLAIWRGWRLPTFSYQKRWE